MSEETRCPKCGLILAANAPRGLCPGCLFKEALESRGATTEGYFTSKGADTPPPTPEELAASFPDLEMIRFVGRGGMGMVYLAKQKQLERLVAVKILSPHIARNPNFADRFAREARLMALLTHPHVVTIFEFGTTSPNTESDGPLYYLLMEFVDGVTLRQLLNEGQLSPAQAFAIVPQICEALQFAHDKGVVHRDIKPENILLDRQGNVKIADFGLAKLMGLQSHDLTLSATGQVLGTLYYMAPEQMERPTDVDHRADIYSLGVVFYQMLTGELPLGRFAPPSKKAVVDARLDEVVLRALEKEPARRYQQASALRSQVEAIATTSFVEPADNQAAAKHPRRWFPDFDGISKFTRIILITVVLLPVLMGMAFTGLGIVYWAAVKNSPNFQLTNSGRPSLADSPQELKAASTDQVIEAGIEKPFTPWTWQELERRTVNIDNANKIIDGLTESLHRDHPNGLSEPLHWVDKYLDKLDGYGLFSAEKKLRLLEALIGTLKVESTVRMREGTQTWPLQMEWNESWHHDRFGLTLLNEMVSITLDSQPLTLRSDSNRYGGPTSDQFYSEFPLPLLTPGTHSVHIEVLGEFVLKSDTVGMQTNAISANWPPSKKRWTRTADIELTVYPRDEVIISKTDDPAFDPVGQGLNIEPIIIRSGNNGKLAVLKFHTDLKKQIHPTPYSFDVSLKIDGRNLPCGSLWMMSFINSRGQHSRRSNGDVMTVEIPEIDASLQHADVILIPNPKYIELMSDVDRYWGKETEFRNVILRRLDSPGSVTDESSQSVKD